MGRLQPAWWRPLATLALTVLASLALFFALIVALILVGSSNSRLERAIDHALATEQLSGADPLSLAIMLVMLALLVPACRWAVRMAGRRGTLDSVEGHFRWGLFWRGTLPALAVLGVSLGITLLVSPPHVHIPAGAAVSALVVLVGVPLQAAGEEYFFRGLLPQVVGSWLRSPAWGVLVSAPLFVAGHEQNAPGMVALAVFAASASWVVWRTGGLEVVVAWHAVNNLVAFGAEITGLSRPGADITWGGACFDMASTLLMVGLVELAWRRGWHRRYRAVASLPVLDGGDGGPDQLAKKSASAWM